MTGRPEGNDQPCMLVLMELPDSVLEDIRRVIPSLRVHRLRRADLAFADLLPYAEVIVGFVSTEDITRAGRLRWLQLGSAGANRVLDHLPKDVILTNASGVFGVPMAEHILAMMLALTRALPESIQAGGECRWSQPAERAELFGATCGILGLGDVGTELARRVKALGMRVLAIKRQPAGRPDFVDALWDPSGLDRLLAESDHVVNCLPGTLHTRHLLDAGRIARMKPSARFYNVGRGSTVDEAALVDALQNGRLAGAGLDVFETEPLPPSSPLWRLPNVIITPHRSAQSSRYAERFTPILLRNAEHYVRGEPLENVVDRHWGY